MRTLRVPDAWLRQPPLPKALGGMSTDETDIKISNYMALFVDLLGQRQSLDGCGLLPEELDDSFIEVVKSSIGSIKRLHNQFDEFFGALTQVRRNWAVPQEHLEEYNQVQATELKFQRFSDGLVTFVSLQDTGNLSGINGVYGLIASAGSLCLLGLASEKPIRGGADIAWGAELNENELYGCVVANSYRLESEVAKYPRIVLGQHVVNYLQAVAQNGGDDFGAKYSREIAELCLDLVCKAPDGEYMVDFLGSGFRQHIANNLESVVFDKALSYVEAQKAIWDKSNRKLFVRYSTLHEYFLARSSIWAS